MYDARRKFTFLIDQILRNRADSVVAQSLHRKRLSGITLFASMHRRKAPSRYPR